ARGSRGHRAAASATGERDRRQQLDRVVVARRTRRGRARLAHRAGEFEGVAARAAAVLVPRHGYSVGATIGNTRRVASNDQPRIIRPSTPNPRASTQVSLVKRRSEPIGPAGPGPVSLVKR